VTDNHEIRVSAPAHPEYLHVLRSVAASVAARLDFSIDTIEDLKIAVDEAAVQLLRNALGGSLELHLLVSPDRLEIVATTDAPSARPWPPEGYERSITWQVLTALTDETSFERRDGAAVRFTKRRLPAGG
jgi:serine/threonine-protein kinase RsbW